MEYQDSRRLTGPNLLWDHPGAVVETLYGSLSNGKARDRESARADEAIALWQEIGRRSLDALG
ncbi:MAG: hypothetical protein KDB14_06235, partial [Planctomycetales bacterium]|nr:hypothetical protein [Planctomycetales bacterium]